MRKISLRRAGFHPLSLFADAEKAPFGPVNKLETGVEKVVRKMRVIAGKLTTGTSYAGELFDKCIEGLGCEADQLNPSVESHLRKS